MTKRRQLLKSIGAIGIAGVAPPVSGLEDDEELEYRGVTYDSTTLQAQGECSVTIKGGESNRFLMNIPGHEVAFSAELNSKEGDPARASARTKAHDLGNQGGEVLLRSTFQGPYFTGIITRPSREYGNLGFTMMDSSTDVRVNEIEGALPNKAESPASEHLSEIPDAPTQGIPQKTAMKNIAGERRRD